MILLPSTTVNTHKITFKHGLLHSNNNNNIILSPISNVYKHTSSVDCTQHGLYNLKQYDHNRILNELVILHYCIL